jgi:translation initiation factor 2B subunit (eIF-2B alpha/beta/delta family)
MEDTLVVVIVSVLPDGGKSAGAMAARLRAFAEEKGVDLRVEVCDNISRVSRALAGAHGLLLDAVAVDCQGHTVVAASGAALAAAAANAAGVRVLALALAHDVLGLGANGARKAVAGLRRARAHPGPVMGYAEVKAAGAGLMAVNPVYDLVPLKRIDAVVTSVGTVGADAVELIGRLEDIAVGNVETEGEGDDY